MSQDAFDAININLARVQLVVLNKCLIRDLPNYCYVREHCCIGQFDARWTIINDYAESSASSTRVSCENIREK